MQPPDTRHSLIARLQNPANEMAWAEFVAAYEPFLSHLVRRHGAASQHVPDVTQQVLAAIAHSVERWRDDGSPASFRRWMTRVARNVAIKYLAREWREVTGQGGSDFCNLLMNVPDADAEQSQSYEFELILWAAEKVRAEFRESSWKAFWGTVIEGRPVQVLAEELNVTPGSIYMSRSRIMARIRAEVRELND